MQILDGDVTLHGNLIADNQASYGGGIEIQHANVYAAANQVLHNRSSSAWLLSVPDVHLVAHSNVVAGSNQRAFNVMEGSNVHVELVQRQPTLGCPFYSFSNTTTEIIKLP